MITIPRNGRAPRFVDETTVVLQTDWFPEGFVVTEGEYVQPPQRIHNDLYLDRVVEILEELTTPPRLWWVRAESDPRIMAVMQPNPGMIAVSSGGEEYGLREPVPFALIIRFEDHRQATDFRLRWA